MTLRPTSESPAPETGPADTRAPFGVARGGRSFRLDQDRAPYLEALAAYARRDPRRFHVPGHKGGATEGAQVLRDLGEQTLRMDVPAFIRGIDIGPEPSALDEALALAADAWGARSTSFLLNGSSEGSHALCLALATAGRDVVIQRNVHVSTIHGLVLSGLRPTFVEPEIDPDLGIPHCVTPERLDDALARTPAAVGAVVLSPTYYGATADLPALVEVARAHDAALIVDEAWGAHFAFHDVFPLDAVSAGADLVVSGTHKIVGSLTQSAMLHLGHRPPSSLDERSLGQVLGLIESTSPSSLLIASLDAARRFAAVDGRQALDGTLAEVEVARSEIDSIHGLSLLEEALLDQPGVEGLDPLRIAVDVRASGVGGYELADAMHRRSDVNLELVTEDVAIAHVGMGETAAGWGEGLAEAFADGLHEAGAPLRRRTRRFSRAPSWGQLAQPPREAFFAAQQVVPLADAAGLVAAESLSVYPPGTSTVLPGERLTPSMLAYLQRVLRKGGHVRGAADPTFETIRVVADQEAARAMESRPARRIARAGSFRDFPARPYLDKYYGAVGDENAAMLRAILEALAVLDGPTDSVIEVAGGPSLFSLMAIVAHRRRPFERVTFTDIALQNLLEVEHWLESRPGRFDYDQLVRWLTDESGAEAAQIVGSLRSSRWELVSFDWRAASPGAWAGAYDVVSSHFFAESVTHSEDEFVELLRALPRIGRPGAMLLLSFLNSSTGYEVDGHLFPAFSVNERTIFEYLERAGVRLLDPIVSSVPAEAPTSQQGYEGLFFVSGRLPTLEDEAAKIPREAAGAARG